MIKKALMDYIRVFFWSHFKVGILIIFYLNFNFTLAPNLDFV